MNIIVRSLIGLIVGLLLGGTIGSFAADWLVYQPSPSELEDYSGFMNDFEKFEYVFWGAIIGAFSGIAVFGLAPVFKQFVKTEQNKD